MPLQPTGIDAGGTLWIAKDDHGAKRRSRNRSRSRSRPAKRTLIATVDESAFAGMCRPTGRKRRELHAGWRGRVHLCRQSEGRGADHGVGQRTRRRADDMARILEPFEQAGRGIADHAQGAGLGLTLVKALAELHGGTLSIASTQGEGSHRNAGTAPRIASENLVPSFPGEVRFRCEQFESSSTQIQFECRAVAEGIYFLSFAFKCR